MPRPHNTLLASAGTTIFTVMSALAAEHDAINLGQGFPDGDGPPDVIDVAAAALRDGRNQYAPRDGVPELRRAVADANRRWYGLDIDPAHVLITGGATEGITACLMALLDPGDECVLFEPLFDIYLPIIQLIGAVPKIVRLHPPDWRLDIAALEAAITPRTKAILVNSPMNPTGAVLTREEVAALARICVAHDLYAICDEVYEHLTDAETPHIPLMTMPGMHERTLRVGSAGKTFSVTGWKIGYVSTTAALFTTVGKAHQNLIFSIAPNLQRAIAHGLQKDDAYFVGMRDALAAKRARIATGLAACGFGVLPSRGSYFVVGDIAPLGLGMDDVTAARVLTQEARVATIPCSSFYQGADPPRTLLRFAVAKRDEVLDEAIARLHAWVAARGGA
ncbi:MAG: aminotransferase [Gemmatimonadaceae bacterium]|nr:aminotransferase [Gemmatimonadaceae bacterium]